ncbi:MAG: ferrous iron transport protein B, partial [Muribaculaceae bacterium]|nr:ferrous iron transport protein B [Muribaculaceae bacterium]
GFFGLYFLGIVVAVITARLLRKFWFKTDETPFVMELPPYRMPTGKAIMRGMWNKAHQYINKMGGVILVASVIIWTLSYFPRYSFDEIPDKYKAETLAEIPENVRNSSDSETIDDMILNSYQQEHSILGNIGKAVEPVLRPMEFGWKTTVSLLAGAAAKEVVVSTLGVLYVGEDDADLISQRLQTPSRLTGQPPFTKAKAIAFLVFVLLYFPCIATLAAIARETESWKYALFSALYNTALAWILSFTVFRIALLF